MHPLPDDLQLQLLMHELYVAADSGGDAEHRITAMLDLVYRFCGDRGITVPTRWEAYRDRERMAGRDTWTTPDGSILEIELPRRVFRQTQRLSNEEIEQFFRSQAQQGDQEDQDDASR